MMKNHPYHLVDYSPWPILGALSTLIMMTGIIKWFHLNSINLLVFGMSLTLSIMFFWWRDVIRESTFMGIHTKSVTLNMRWGMILFITSEVLFFMSFFWSFFHSSLSPSIELGMIWPPSGMLTFNPLQIPLLNTIILISSGISITWAHHSLMLNNYKQMTNALLITIIMGLYFSLLQAFEYLEAPFTMADSVYGSSFFMATGFHGLHVIIGTIFLTVALMRHYLNHFSMTHHFGFEASAWYWHFVDVVWLFLYISIYWWGS